MANLNQILSELKKFDKSLYQFFEAAKQETIFDFEKKLGYYLPKDFKEFLLFSNGAIILMEDILGVNTDLIYLDIYSTYFFETKEAGNPMPEYLLPISPNGRGDHYCLDLNSLDKTGEICNVVFWQHDYAYDEEDRPRLVANSFYDYLLEIINDYLEDYNYDGTEK